MSAYREAELENWILSDPHQLRDAILIDPSPDEDRPPLVFLGSQITCMFGRIDALAYYRANLFIIEYKAVPAGEEVAGQLERYRRSIHELMPPEPLMRYISTYPRLIDIPVMTVAIAPSFAHKALMCIDFCIEASVNGQDGFVLKPARNKAPQWNEQSELRKLLTPYYYHLLNHEQETHRRMAEAASIRDAKDYEN